MAKQCAYCGHSSGLTREHIWPAGFLKRGSFDVKFSAKAQRTFRGDLTISDVCKSCNNGPLGKLDEYACSLFDRYFGKFVEAGETIAFDYDYGLLMRWLLKVAYNSSRTTGNHEPLLSAYAATITSLEPCSPVFAVAFLATAKPSFLIDTRTGTFRKLYPEQARSGPIGFHNLQIPDCCIVRAIWINSYIFSLVVTSEPTIAPYVMSEVFANLPGTHLVPTGLLHLPAPVLDTSNVVSGVEGWPRTAN